MASKYVSQRGKDMSRYNNSELNDTDFQGSLDSASLPSEPPDIRNWFPSYKYESPELNTLDDFLDLNGSRETCLEEKNKGKSKGNQPVGELDDGLLAAAKESSDGIVKCNASNESGCSKSADVVTGLSESLPLSSEPPDIKKWFPSYCYESPLLDTHEFTISDHKEREDGKLINAEKSCTRGNKDVMDFIDVEDNIELPSRTSGMVVISTSLTKDTKLDFQSVCKDGHNVGVKSTPAISSLSTSEKVPEHILSGKIPRKSNHGPVQKFEITSTYGRTSPKLLKMEGNAGRKDRVNDNLEKEALCEIIPPVMLNSTAPKGDHRRRPINESISGKENEVTELLDDGFITTRKKSIRAHTRIITRHVDGVKSEVNCETVAVKPTKVLSEISNVHFPNVVEGSGKWLCPQKSKPNLGPPLKQLRLERWVRPA